MHKLTINHFKEEQTAQVVSWGHWFTFFNIFLVTIIGFQYLLVADFPSVGMGRFYAILSGIGHFSFLCFVLYLVTLFPLNLLIQSQRKQRIIATTVATLGISLLLIDIQIFTHFKMHLNFSIWSILTSKDADFLNRIFVAIPFILLFETLLAIWSWKKLRSLNKRKRYAKRVGLFFTFCFILAHLIHIWADANFYRPITMQRSSLPLSYPLTARHLLAKYGFLDEQKYQTRLKEEGDPSSAAIEYPLGPIKYTKALVPNNVLLIVVDGWDLRTLNQAMPWLDRFAKQNIEFTHHYAASHDPYLNDFSLFYGLDPNYYNSILASHKPSALLETFANQRYNLGLFSVDDFNAPLYRRALFSNFSLPEYEKPPQPAADALLNRQPQGTYKTNKQVSDFWLSWYTDQLKLGSHAALFSVVKYSLAKGNNNETDDITMRAADLDRHLETMITFLKRTGEYEHTIIMITGSKSAPINLKHRVDREQLKVPLIMAWPAKKPLQESAPTSHTDIVSTLMQEGLGVTSPLTQYSQGVNLFAMHSEGSTRKWVIAGNENDIAALYPDKTIMINAFGKTAVFDLDNQLQKDKSVALSAFLQIITTNRRFMVLQN